MEDLHAGKEGAKDNRQELFIMLEHHCSGEKIEHWEYRGELKEDDI